MTYTDKEFPIKLCAYFAPKLVWDEATSTVRYSIGTAQIMTAGKNGPSAGEPYPATMPKNPVLMIEPVPPPDGKSDLVHRFGHNSFLYQLKRNLDMQMDNREDARIALQNFNFLAQHGRTLLITEKNHYLVDNPLDEIVHSLPSVPVPVLRWEIETDPAEPETISLDGCDRPETLSPVWVPVHAINDIFPIPPGQQTRLGEQFGTLAMGGALPKSYLQVGKTCRIFSSGEANKLSQMKDAMLAKPPSLPACKQH